jgi:hypothetical protein
MVNGYPASGSSGIEAVNDNRPDFTITSNTSWTISVAYSAGSGWVTGFPSSGYGSQDIYLGIGDNNSGVTREATLTIFYCDGKSVNFTIKQGASRKINVVVWVTNNQVKE